MTVYAPPLRDMRFVLNELLQRPAHAEADDAFMAAVIEEAGKLASGVLAPLNRPGDQEGAALADGAVKTPAGFRDAYDRFVAGGWGAVPFDPAHGGQGLPWALQTALFELWFAANLALANCPMLTQGAVELLSAHGTAEQKSRFLPKLITGEWSGTMCLTESHAGTDLGALRTRAVGEGDHYRITGTKIFITYGEHDLAKNIVHMVLARVVGAPEGVPGVSLFLVPKFLVGADGRPGARNDLRCVGLERKLGIHGSPTCVMAFGDAGGAVGTLVGREGGGVAAMFTMMNNARLGVGLQGLGIAERAYQQAVAYAKTRVQSRPIDGSADAPVPIIRHPDVRRMLLTMRAYTEGVRALAYSAAVALDRSRGEADPGERRFWQARLDLLIPVVKAFSTDIGVELASLGIQVHGGTGFIEETGAAQLYRDARIAPIYEGTNGIQALDLVRRKLTMDGGQPMAALVAEMRQTLAGLDSADSAQQAIGRALGPGIDALESAATFLRERMRQEPLAAAAGATAFLRLFALVACGELFARAARIAGQRLAAGTVDGAFYQAKRTTARFFAEHLLPAVPALLGPITSGAETLFALPDEAF
ncbi:MAG: acyl-CoA dehydrogenase [Alphaproteobacteria bacterium]|nr:acyl-CoA dehydrogenase [Alphaproteobacteria bacterium]